MLPPEKKKKGGDQCQAQELFALAADRAFVELFVVDRALVSGLALATARLRTWGTAVSAAASSVLVAGLAAAAPFIAALKIFGDYEQALADLRAAANPTAEAFTKIQEKIEAIAAQSGVAPTQVAKGFTELIKAGISVEQVLGGVGQTAIEFARVGGLEMAEAAITLVDAMNVFAKEGLSAVQAADIISKAADASSISIADLSGSFKTGGSPAALFGQSMQDTAIALGLLGSAGVKAEDAGTVLKVVLSRLATGSDTTQGAMDRLGLRVRDASGEMLPFPALIQELQDKLGGLNTEARDRALADLFGERGIRGASILLQKGAAGWEEFTERLSESLGVSEKFAIMTNTFSGNLGKLWVQVQLAAIAVGEALAPALGLVGGTLAVAVHALGRWIKQNKTVVGVVAASVVAVLALAVALKVLGLLLKLLSVILVIPWVVFVIAVVAAKVVMLAFTVAVVLVKVAILALSAALVVLKLLLAGVGIVGLVVAAALGLVLAAAVAVLVGAVWAAFKAVQAMFGVLLQAKNFAGPLEHIGRLFGEWRTILEKVAELARTNLPAAMEVARAGIALGISQIRDLWPPLWEFIRGGFAILWELVSAQFEARFTQALVAVATKVSGFIDLFGLAGEKIAALKDLAAVEGEAANVAVRLAEAQLKQRAGAFTVPESAETRAARQELQAAIAEAERTTAAAKATGRPTFGFQDIFAQAQQTPGVGLRSTFTGLFSDLIFGGGTRVEQKQLDELKEIKQGVQRLNGRETFAIAFQ